MQRLSIKKNRTPNVARPWTLSLNTSGSIAGQTVITSRPLGTFRTWQDALQRADDWVYVEASRRGRGLAGFPVPDFR